MKSVSREPEEKSGRFASAICLLLLFLILASGFCFMLSKGLVNALYQSLIRGG